MRIDDDYQDPAYTPCPECDGEHNIEVSSGDDICVWCKLKEQDAIIKSLSHHVGELLSEIGELEDQNEDYEKLGIEHLKLQARERELVEKVESKGLSIFQLVERSKDLSKALDACREYRVIVDELEELNLQQKEEIEQLIEQLRTCWHIANCYDGNYVTACDNIMDTCKEYVK